MAMRDVARLAACFIADPAAQATSVKNVCRHLKYFALRTYFFK